MSAAPWKIQFPFDLDDLADVSCRSVLETPVGRSFRRQEILWSGVAGFVFFALLLSITVRPQTLGDCGLVALMALPVGVVMAGFRAQTYESRCKSRVRRFLAQDWNPNNAHVCEIELRPDVMWLRQPHLEVTYRWQDFISGDDLPEGVELRFRGGYALARSRAFETREEQTRFLAEARACGSTAQRGS
jgi:hypothetical protein